jgi:imidazolonepropionase-like amidohydrolase
LENVFMRRVFLAASVAVLASFVATAQTRPPDPSTFVIRAGTLIDPETGAAASNQTIVVEAGKITAAGSKVDAPAGATEVDLSGQAVMPGLFDAHTHLCMDVNVTRDAGSYFLTTLQDSIADRAVQGVVNARSMLEAGFTTVRDVGNEGRYACVSVRNAIDRGALEGPTMITAGRIIAPYGGQFHLQPDRPELAEPEYFFADSRDEMRKAVRENVHYGARVIKIVVDDQPYIYSEDDIRFIVGEAAKAGVKVAAHVWTRAGAHNAAAAGVASLEHLNGITDDDLKLAKRNGVTAVFTPMPQAFLQQFRFGEDAAKEEFATEIDRLRSGARIGIPIAFGSDAILELPGMTRGVTTIQWVDCYTAAGLAPKDILRAMTTTAAKLFGVDKERGAIKPQMAADIIAMPGNPLDDISALKRVSFVMKNGRIIKR